MSSLLLLALVVATGILLSSMLLPFYLPSVSADSSDTNTDQDMKQKNTGSGDSANSNCGENLIDSTVSVICLTEAPPLPPLETATLSVCKFEGSNILTAEEFLFTVTGNNPSAAQFFGNPSGPGEFVVSEVNTGPRGITSTQM
jgi:hypothetical protein